MNTTSQSKQLMRSKCLQARTSHQSSSRGSVDTRWQQRLGEKWGLATLLLLAILAASSGPADAYEHRRNTPSLGAQLQYGYMGGDSAWPNTVRWGWGVAFKLRKYVSRQAAMGVSFEQQKFDRISTLPSFKVIGDDYADLDHLQFQTLMLDYFRYFQRMRRRTPYVVVSAGIYHPQLLYDEKNEITGTEGQHSKHPRDSFIARLGAGLEYFVNRGFSIDGSVSCYYVHTPDLPGRTFTVQMALGCELYPGR
ncbi:MAG: outer membrane beta-barrel protein [Candidatus Eisenbacteria sp.]|nr:outer membrane beta-barrel protein [Candidatus Eisenbacteria bacterium]